jgi:hypothetical protein
VLWVRDLVPSQIVVERVGIDALDLGPRVNLNVTWRSTSGEPYVVCVLLLTRSVAHSLVGLLLDGALSPLELEALDKPVS